MTVTSEAACHHISFFALGGCLLWAILAVLTVSWDAMWSNSHLPPLNSGGAMGSRGRSIRLRIYFLVAIPLIAMAGLLAYAAGTSIINAIDLDRVPNLINKAGIPAATFGAVPQAGRAAARVYPVRPDAAQPA